MAGNASLCTSPACVQLASSFLWSVAPSHLNIDPCTSFEQYACYGANETYPEDNISGNVAMEQSMRVLRIILESEYEPPTNGTTLAAEDKSTEESLVEAMQTDYRLCMDESALAEKGHSPLGAVVDEIRSKFPVNGPGTNTTAGPGSNNTTAGPGTNGTAGRDENLGEVLTYLGQLGIHPFADVAAVNDPLEPVRGRVVVMLSPTPPLPFEAAEGEGEEAKRERVSSYAKALQALLPGNMTQQQAARLATGVADLEAAVKGITPDSEAEDPAADTSHESLDGLAQLTPALGYDKVVGSLVPARDAVGNVTILHRDFFGNLSEKVSAAPRDVFQAYLVVKTASSFVDVSSPVLDPLKGPRPPGLPPRERWQECVRQVKMVWVLSRLFVAAKLPPESKKAGDDLMTAIRERFVQSMEDQSWVSPEDKEKITAKANNMTQIVGYQTSSPNNEDIQDIAAFYSGLNITADHFANALSHRAWKTRKQFGRVGKPIDREALEDEPSWIVNATYDPQGNVIHIFAGYMLAPLFSADLTLYVQFGALGSIMGHELVHGFDDAGRKYSLDGKVEAWWDNKTSAAFDERAACFEDQYSNYTVPTPEGPRAVNGSMTLGENIADAGGLHLSWDAWKARRGDDEASLPGLDRFTHEQLFYIAHAMTFCASERAKGNERALAAAHAPSYARIRGTSANSRGFIEAFDCPVKEPVCELW